MSPTLCLSLSLLIPLPPHSLSHSYSLPTLSFTQLVPFKKQFLLRWQNAEVSEESASSDKQQQELAGEKSVKPVEFNRGEVESERSSPLFEDFSDSEDFEVDQKKSVSNLAEASGGTVKEDIATTFSEYLNTSGKGVVANP